jgi:DNA polymerase III delta prime subunit
VLDTVERCDLPLSSFDLESGTFLSAMTALRKPGPGLLLFYGEPGTGKTELSKRLVLDAGKRPCFLNNSDYRRRSYSSLCIASKLIDQDRDVLIIDEAEALLSTNKFSGDDDWAKQKSLINQFFDEYQKKMILIVNSTWHISDSTLRRMHVLIGFKPLTCAQRKKVWGDINETNPVFSRDEQRQLSVDFPANPARIRQVQDICGELFRTGAARETILDTARDMLGRSAELLSGTSYRKKRSGQPIAISLLNASVPVADLIDRIGRWNDAHEAGGDGLNLLFYGIPGTGKTAFARHLVGAVGLPLVLKRASDLLDPYVGGTERKLREAFDEAKDCALVIDEADSFLTERSSAVRTWERAQVNEFLTCMESFSGLFIATTNFTSLLDAASRRRFHLKVEFFAPDAIRRVALARHFFGRLDWAADDEARLVRLEGLTPGDFDAVSRRLRYADDIDASTVCEELECESGFRNAPRIGF